MLMIKLLSYKQFLILKGLVEGYSMHKTSRITDITFSHTIKVASSLEIAGIIRKLDVGKRSKKIIITDKGKKVFDYYCKILSLMGDK